MFWSFSRPGTDPRLREIRLQRLDLGSRDDNKGMDNLILVLGSRGFPSRLVCRSNIDLCLPPPLYEVLGHGPVDIYC